MSRGDTRCDVSGNVLVYKRLSIIFSIDTCQFSFRTVSFVEIKTGQSDVSECAEENMTNVSTKIMVDMMTKYKHKTCFS